MALSEKQFYDKIDEVKEVIRFESSLLSSKLDAHSADDARRFAEHTEQLLIIATERRGEKQTAQADRDQRVSRSTWVTMAFTGGLGLLELLAHWRSWGR